MKCPFFVKIKEAFKKFGEKLKKLTTKHHDHCQTKTQDQECQECQDCQECEP